MTETPELPRFRRGWPQYRRAELREQLLQAELVKARRRAATMNTSLTCRNAMVSTGVEDAAYVTLLHQQCRGELPGGSGCLCVCHDVFPSGEGEIVTGSVQIPV